MENHGETRIYTRRRPKNGCQPDCETMKILGPNLTKYQLAIWADNNVKFNLNLSRRWRRTPNKNKVGMK